MWATGRPVPGDWRGAPSRAERMERGGWRWRAVGVHAVVVAAIGAFAAVERDPAAILRTGGAVMAVLLLGLGINEARHSRLRLTPLSFYFFWYSAGLGLSAVYYGSLTQDGSPVDFSTAWVWPEQLAQGYVFCLLGSLALHAGIQISRPFGSPHAEPESDCLLNLPFLVGLWLVGIFFLWNPESVTFLGIVGRIVQQAALPAVAAFALSGPERFGLSRLRFALLLGVGTAGVLVGHLNSGSKSYLMFSFLPIFWLFMERRRLRRWLPLLALTLAAVYFVLVAPAIGRSRESPRTDGQSNADRLMEVLREDRNDLGGGTFDLGEGLDAFLKRQFDPIAVAYLIGETEVYGLQWGRTMQYATYALIPRALWPDKPTITQGAWFAWYTGFAASPESSTMALGMTAVGELFWNFGLLGVTLGMLLLGYFLGLQWRLAGADPRGRPLNMLLYMLLLFLMVNMAEAVNVAVTVIANFLLFSVATYVANAFVRRRHRLPRGGP